MAMARMRMAGPSAATAVKIAVRSAQLVKPIGRVFNIAAGKNSSRLREQGGANLEPGIRSISVAQGRLGCVQKRLPLARG